MVCEYDKNIVEYLYQTKDTESHEDSDFCYDWGVICKIAQFVNIVMKILFLMKKREKNIRFMDAKKGMIHHLTMSAKILRSL